MRNFVADFLLLVHTNYTFYLGDCVSSLKNDGNFAANSFTASSMAVARPTYDSEPASGKDAVFTGALAIRKRISTFLV